MVSLFFSKSDIILSSKCCSALVEHSNHYHPLHKVVRLLSKCNKCDHKTIRLKEQSIKKNQMSV